LTEEAELLFGYPVRYIGGAALVLIGLYNFLCYTIRSRTWHITRGQVVGHTERDEDRNFLIIISYLDQNDVRHTVKGNIGGIFGPPVGTGVRVCYNPQKPEQAFVCNASAKYIIPMILVGLGLALLAL